MTDTHRDVAERLDELRQQSVEGASSAASSLIIRLQAAARDAAALLRKAEPAESEPTTELRERLAEGLQLLDALTTCGHGTTGSFVPCEACQTRLVALRKTFEAAALLTRQDGEREADGYTFEAVLSHMDREIADAERSVEADQPEKHANFYRGMRFALQRARLRLLRAMGRDIFAPPAPEAPEGETPCRCGGAVVARPPAGLKAYCPKCGGYVDRGPDAPHHGGPPMTMGEPMISEREGRLMREAATLAVEERAALISYRDGYVILHRAPLAKELGMDGDISIGPIHPDGWKDRRDAARIIEHLCKGDVPEPSEKMLREAFEAGFRFARSGSPVFDRWLATREPDASGEEL